MLESQVGFAQQLFRAVMVFAIVTLLGALGYYAIEGDNPDWTFLDAVYMAVITVSTVGLKEVHDLNPTGRIFTIVLIVFGVGAFMYLATSLAHYVIAGELTVGIGSELEGITIGSGQIRAKSGAMLVAIRQRTGKMLVAPSSQTGLSAGDIIVALGTGDQMQRLRDMSHA